MLGEQDNLIQELGIISFIYTRSGQGNVEKKPGEDQLYL
jgi:hypothetical protein